MNTPELTQHIGREQGSLKTGPWAWHLSSRKRRRISQRYVHSELLQGSRDDSVPVLKELVKATLRVVMLEPVIKMVRCPMGFWLVKPLRQCAAKVDGVVSLLANFVEFGANSNLVTRQSACPWIIATRAKDTGDTDSDSETVLFRHQEPCLANDPDYESIIEKQLGVELVGRPTVKEINILAVGFRSPGSKAASHLDLSPQDKQPID
ncbi:hypothetical protein QBC36DRAFT_90988 [Triangularia setosa]|uniref:Uncharacterized protein n=1 Tax=Triangularia setosa TaxID=2587417 RepID=A0AAN7A9C5_9PEZI|nr:hypothetical protein QBC36DRAFT_90988 [Podospora setosa]